MKNPKIRKHHFLPTLVILLNLGAAIPVLAYYDPGVQRWINRDPMEEQGGDNVFCPMQNDLVNTWDSFGLFGDGRCYGPESDPSSKWLGHSDFYGAQWFDFTAEDHDPKTSPMDPVKGAPQNHFQDLHTSLGQVQESIEAGDAASFSRAMHRLQDYYSHYQKGYRWPWTVGHLFSVHGPDHDNAAWLRAERMTRSLVKKWIRKNGIPAPPSVPAYTGSSCTRNNEPTIFPAR